MSSSLTLGLDFRTQRFADAARGLQVVADHVGRTLDKAPERIRSEIKDFLDGVAEALEQRHGTPWPGGTTSKSLSKRSGFLLTAIKDSVKVKGTTISTIEGSISVPKERAIHEKGGIVRPVNAKYLAIPLPAALDSRGVPLKKSARDWANTFVIRSKAGNLLIVQKNGVSLTPLYVLKNKVYIPPRLKMGETIRAGQSYLVDKIVEAILKSVQEA